MMTSFVFPKNLLPLEVAPPWITSMKNDQTLSSPTHYQDRSPMKQGMNITPETSIQEEDPMKDYFERKKRDEKTLQDHETTLIPKSPIKQSHFDTSSKSSSKITSSHRKIRERQYSSSSHSRSRTPSVERSNNNDDRHRHHYRRHHHHRSKSPEHPKYRHSYRD